MGGSVSLVLGDDAVAGSHGGAMSEQDPNSFNSGRIRRKGPTSGRLSGADGTGSEAPGKVRSDLHRIFQRSTMDDDNSQVTAEMMKPVQHPEEVMELLRTSMSGFFWLQYDAPQTDDEAAKNRIEMIIKYMQKEEIAAGNTLIREGGVGDKLFVVQSGELAVTINGEPIRNIGPGALLGELALIYDSPRSATVTATTDCVIYSLLRTIFKRVLSISRDAATVQRSRWLLSSPELAVLSPNNLTRLVSSLKVAQFPKAALLYTELGLSQDIMLVERGTAKVYSTMDLSGMPEEEVDKMFGILRPKRAKGKAQRQKSVSDMTSLKELQNFMNPDGFMAVAKSDGSFRVASPPQLEEHERTLSPGEDTLSPLPQLRSTGTTNSMAVTGATGYRNKDQVVLFACGEVYEGCILGIGALRGRAGMPNAWRWVPRADLKLKGLSDSVELAEVPFTVEASTGMECSYFTVQAFEALFGPISKAFAESGEDQDADAVEFPERTGIAFDVTKFKIISVLGSGSFGTVTLAEYDDQKEGSGTPNKQLRRYALKSLSKSAIIETGQQRHVLDEKKLLFQMDSPFIIKLFGVYQTPHQLVMVTEAVECGDLWGVIYEEELVSQAGGIPCRLAQFYSASLICALGHMHEKNIAYRDLKPENVMVDRNGYLRVIDFGFAKRVPCKKVEADGTVKTCMQTFTLCGTPEYLPPELIFNLGHDKASDLWSLGVVVYEMIMGRTPFAPKKPDNITELFTNIAMAKKNGLMLSSRIDERTNHTPAARELVTQLLKPEPLDRLGGKSSTLDLLRCSFFSSLDLQALQECRLVPDHIPPVSTKGDSAGNLQPVKAYYGDQSLFEFF